MFTVHLPDAGTYDAVLLHPDTDLSTFVLENFRVVALPENAVVRVRTARESSDAPRKLEVGVPVTVNGVHGTILHSTRDESWIKPESDDVLVRARNDTIAYRMGQSIDDERPVGCRVVNGFLLPPRRPPLLHEARTRGGMDDRRFVLRNASGERDYGRDHGTSSCPRVSRGVDDAGRDPSDTGSPHLRDPKHFGRYEHELDAHSPSVFKRLGAVAQTRSLVASSRHKHGGGRCERPFARESTLRVRQGGFDSQ